MKIGIIYCCYGNPQYINNCLTPWVEAKKEHNILIAAVHGQFKEYHDLGIEDNDIESAFKLAKLLNNNINYLYVQNPIPKAQNLVYQTESEIRDKGLQWLLQEDCDYIWLLDNDEFYNEQQINNIISYLKKVDNEFISWFTINMKNYIFNGKQWIDGFCPARIFKVKYGNCKLHRFYYDNDVIYKNIDFGNEINYKNLPMREIARSICHLKHLTWLNLNGRKKVDYQLKHFGSCSYKWNEEKQELEFDLDFYKKNGLSLPIIYKDE